MMFIYRYDHYGRVCSGDYKSNTNMNGYDLNLQDFYNESYED